MPDPTADTRIRQALSDLLSEGRGAVERGDAERAWNCLCAARRLVRDIGGRWPSELVPKRDRLFKDSI